MAGKRFWSNDQARAVAAQLIRSEPELRHHQLLSIFHVFEDPGKPGDWATTTKLPALAAALISGLAEDRAAVNATPSPMFIIRYCWSDWTHVLDDDQREALVHHELHHIDPVTGGLLGHDVEEFVRTFKKYGAYHHTLGLFTSAP